MALRGVEEGVAMTGDLDDLLLPIGQELATYIDERELRVRDASPAR